VLSRSKSAVPADHLLLYSAIADRLSAFRASETRAWKIQHGAPDRIEFVV